MKRTPISKKVRFNIFKRDGFVCQYCGAHPPSVVLEVDHIIPVADGGGNEIDNLVTSCFNCNRGKGAASLSVVPKSLADKAAEVREREEQLAGYAAVLDARRERIEEDAWRVAVVLQPDAEAGYSTAKLNSVKKFVEALGVHDVLDAADMAVTRKPYSEAQAFKYFCGICWNWIRDGRS